MNKRKDKKEDLTQRAYLNSVTGIIDFSFKQVVGFILNPISISILGPYVYGIWKIIMQLNNYMTMSDVNVSQTLRIVVARERSVVSDDVLRRYFSAGMFANLFFIPFYIFFGTILIWASPYATGAEESYYYLIRVSMSLLVISFIVKQIFSLFEAVLRGMNLAYKRIGIRATVTVIGGILTAFVLHKGYGMIGMAIVQILVGLFTGITIWWIVHKHVEWFGLTKINSSETKKMIKKSGKFMIERFVRIVYKSVDVILLGFFAGPIYVAVYATSKFLVNASTGIINKILPSVTPGFGKLIGEGKYEYLLTIRSNMIFLISYFGLITGIVICLINKSFITIWIGGGYFVGSLETILLVVLGVIYVSQEIDSSLINMSLQIKAKIKLGIASLILTIILGAILVPILQVKGLLISLLFSRIIVSLGYFMILKNILKAEQFTNHILPFKFQILYLLILLPAGYLGNVVNTSNWFVLIFSIPLIFIFTNLMMWFVIFNTRQKFFLRELFFKINFFNKN